MAKRNSTMVLVDKLDTHDEMLLADLPDEDLKYVADDDCSDWFFDRLDREAEMY